MRDLVLLLIGFWVGCLSALAAENDHGVVGGVGQTLVTLTCLCTLVAVVVAVVRVLAGVWR